MTSTQQRAELHRQIWQIANEVRGSVDGWDFKQYVLGTLFYRFISENFANYIEAGDESVNYAALLDEVITADIKDDAIKTKGYFIYPSQLFANVAANAHRNENLNTDLAAIFKEIESSANGYPSEPDIKGLFADFDTTSNRLGNTVADKNTRLAAVLKGVAGLKLHQFEDSEITETIEPYIMARIVDAEAFMKHYPFRLTGEHTDFYFQVTDHDAGWNQGTFYVGIDQLSGRQICRKVEDTETDPKRNVKLDIGTLTAMLMGYKRPMYLYNNERIHMNYNLLKELEQAIPGEKAYFSDYF